MTAELDVVWHIYRLGGVATRHRLVQLTSRRAVDRARRNGSILRDGHGRYAVPVADAAIRAASRLSGIASHRSAAMWWGWEQKLPEHRPEVTVPRRRNVQAARREGLTLHWADLASHEIDGLVTSRQRTIVDCLRRLPFDEALVIADSALRNGSFTSGQLAAIAAGVTGPGAARCRRVAALADSRSADPFESVLRSLASDVSGLRLVPQVPVTLGRLVLHPDLVDRQLRLVAEADSFEWHGSRRALRRDCRRYNGLVLDGWAVLRFSWEDVMHDPAYVSATLRSATALARRRAQRVTAASRAA